MCTGENSDGRKDNIPVTLPGDRYAPEILRHNYRVGLVAIRFSFLAGSRRENAQHDQAGAMLPLRKADVGGGVIYQDGNSAVEKDEPLKPVDSSSFPDCFQYPVEMNDEVARCQVPDLKPPPVEESAKPAVCPRGTLSKT